MAMDRAHLKSIVTEEIYDVLISWSAGLQTNLGENVVGAYLTGSLTYGDFVETRSDIDLAVVVEAPPSQADLERIRQLHIALERQYRRWSERIECSYIPAKLLPNILPPTMPRPWWGFGVLYENAPYGNEWIINQYFLWKCSIALIGPDFNNLVRPVDMSSVQQASARDLFQEWEPKLRDLDWLKDGHYQSYLILNVCRILYTVLHGHAGSKSTAAAWTKRAFPEWGDLIAAAQCWQYGHTMDSERDAIAFVNFAIAKVNESGIAADSF